jgi:hypothetical protein
MMRVLATPDSHQANTSAAGADSVNRNYCANADVECRYAVADGRLEGHDYGQPSY